MKTGIPVVDSQFRVANCFGYHKLSFTPKQPGLKCEDKNIPKDGYVHINVRSDPGQPDREIKLHAGEIIWRAYGKEIPAGQSVERVDPSKQWHPFNLRLTAPTGE